MHLNQLVLVVSIICSSFALASFALEKESLPRRTTSFGTNSDTDNLKLDRSVGIGTPLPDADSALIFDKGSPEGLLVPRVNLVDEFDTTTIGMDPDTGNPKSLLVYHLNEAGTTTLPAGIYYWSGGRWGGGGRRWRRRLWNKGYGRYGEYRRYY